MIVRDEAKLLPGFIQAARGLYDDFCVVDTGSSDGSIELLKQAGARVFEHAWNDDFAAARNFGLAQAKGDWIIYLDADETPDEAFIVSARSISEQEQAGAATMCLRDTFEHGYTTLSHLLRMFRNDPVIRFRHAIHEDVTEGVMAYLYQTNREIARLEGIVNHVGYLPERVAERKKRDLNYRLLKRCIETDPEDLYSWFKMLETTQFWRDTREFQQYVPGALDALERADPDRLATMHYGGEFLALISGGVYGDDPTAELRYLKAWQNRIGASAAYYLRRGQVQETLENLDDAFEDYKTCVGLHSQTANLQLSSLRPLLGMARIALAKRDIEQALGFLNLAITQGPRDPEALLALISLSRTLGGQDGVDRIVDAYKETYGDHPELHGAIGEVALRSGDKELAVRELQLAVAGAVNQTYSDLLQQAQS